MKTTTISTQHIFNFGRYFIADAAAQTLNEVELKAATLTPGVTTYYDANGEVSLVVNDGEDVRIFASVEDYKSGNAAAPTNAVTGKIKVDGVKYGINSDDDGALYAHAYTFADGEPKAVKMYFSSIHYKYHYDISGTFNTEGVVYPDRKTCIGFNPITEKDLDGSTKTIGGELAAISLTPEQKEIVARLEAVLAECKANNISVAYDFGTCDLFAFNGKEYTIGNTYDEEESNMIEDPTMGLYSLKENVEYYNSDCDYCICKK